jgi:PST family polysaccharide transporter
MGLSKIKTFRNILYSGMAKGITLVCVAATSLVVARNLTPADFGVFGFASIIIVFLNHFSDMGVSSAVIRTPVLDQNHLDTAFTLKITLSASAFALTVMIAPFAHRIFDHPAIGNVIRVLALNFLISIIGFLPTAVLTKEMNYGQLVIPGVVASTVQGILAVTLVLHGWRYWAVVIASVGATLASGITVHFVRRVRVHLRFDAKEILEYLRFGVPLFGSGVLVFALFNMDNLLVGGSMGSIMLGYYALAFNWGSFICGLLYDTVNNVLFPAFSALQNDSVAMRRWYLKTVELVGFLAVIANGALLVNAQYFLTTLLGKGSAKWLPATMALQILCIYGIVRAVTEPLGNCLLVRGRTKTMLHANMIAGAIEVGLLLLAIHSGRVSLVAAAVLIAYASQSLIYLPFLRRELSVTSWDVLARVWPLIPAVIVGWLTTRLLPTWVGNTVFSLVLRCLFTASVVAVTHGLCSQFRCFHEAAGLISQNLGKHRRFRISTSLVP